MTWLRDQDYPATPYPGRRPRCSYVHEAATGYPVHADPTASSGWRVGGADDLDDWLVEREVAPLAGRVPVLAYGSNACPSKLTWLRDALGLTGPVVVLRARCAGLAAVWTAGFRVDGARPATLVAMPAVRERHAVLLVTPRQLRVLDVCEGRGQRYRLGQLRRGTVRLADGTVLDRVLAYVGAAPERLPLLVAGAPVRCAQVGQALASTLAGDPHGPSARQEELLDVLTAAPAPEEHPDRLFVYGTLQPGASAWRLLEPLVTGRPRQVTLPGTLLDTGHGYPAMLPGRGPGVPGWLVRLADPGVALSTMDDYEGAEYRRVRRTAPDRKWCWTYHWGGRSTGLRRLTHWPPGQT